MSSMAGPVKQFFLRWLGPLAIMAAIFVISGVLGRPVDEGDLSARVIWPERLSASTPGVLVIVARDTGELDSPPISGASVALYQMSGAGRSRWQSGQDLAEQVAGDIGLRAIATGKTDASGHALIVLPPVTRDTDGAGIQRSEGEDIALLLRVEREGDQRVMRRVYSLPAEARLALTSDRPLYQPGQPIKLRALGVDPDSGRPISGAIKWTARDPRGNLVLQEEGELSAAGIAAIELPLSSQCVQGQYNLQVEYSGVQATLAVDVRPFRLPRYKVEVAPDRGAIQPGETLAGKVRARFTYGDPVGGAQVLMTVVFTRVDGRTEAAEIKGETDAEGVLAFSWQAPPDLRAGDALSVQAVVETEAGRAERGVASVQVGGQRLSMELLASGSAGWLVGVENKGFVIVTDGAGRPVARASVVLKLPEQREERIERLTTDEDGQARFTWTPYTSGLTVRAEISPAEGQSVLIDQSIGGSWGRAFMASLSPTAAVGEPFTFEVGGFSGAGTVVAFNRGYPVAATAVHANGETSIDFGDEARGLVVLRLIDQNGGQQASLPVWVVQRGGEAVEIKADADLHAPGGKASLGLSFPATVDEGQAAPVAPVTFGIVGVDEALYALKERSQLPLGLLLRQDPGQAEAMAGALASVERAKAGGALTRRIEASRFAQRFASSGENFNNHEDLTRDLETIARRPWVHGWVLVLAALVLVLAASAMRTTGRAVTRGAFSWRRAGGLLGVAFAALVCALIMGVASGEALAGGLVVWAGVVLCWAVAAGMRAPEMRLSAWLWSGLGMILLALAIVLTQVSVHVEDWVGVALAGALGLPALALIVEIVLWAFVLHARGMRQPGFGLITIVGILGGGTLGVMGFLTMGRMSPDAARYAEQAMAPSGGAFMAKAEEGAAEREAPAPSAAPAANTPQEAQEAPRVRSFFPETMIWMPEVASDAEGRAKVDLDIPDSITTWRVDATATTWDGRFGDGRLGMRVWQPFFLELELPTHLTAGDRVEVPVSVVNNHDKALRVRLEARGEGALEVVEAPAAVELEAGQRQIAILKVFARSSGVGSVTASAIPDSGQGDAVRREASVRPDGRELTRTRSGLVRKGFRTAIDVPGSALEGSASASAAIFPSAISDAEDGLDGMLRGPMGCFEQTSSANYPNVMILRALRQVEPSKWPKGKEKWQEEVVKARKHLAMGYQKILSFQLDSGAFSLYNDAQSHGWERQPDIMLTAYGVMQLTEMATVYPVDKAVIERATRWLASQQNPGGTWPVYAGRISGGAWRSNDDAAQLRSTAFVAWALLQAPSADLTRAATDKALDHLERSAGESGAPDTVALSVNALVAGRRAEAAAQLSDRLAALAQRQDDAVWWVMSGSSWMGGWGQYADLEATALAAYALLSVEKHGELLQPALRHLAQSRSPWGGWGSTQATVWTLRALEKIRSLDTGRVVLSVFLDEQPWAEDNPSSPSEGKVIVEPGDALVHRFSKPSIAVGQSHFMVQTSSSTAAMAQATARYALAWGDPAAQVNGERLAISIVSNFKAVSRGGQVEVTAKVRNPGRDAYGASIVELPLPPGAFVDPDQFESWQKARLIDTFEVLPTCVRLYISGFDPLQDRAFTYRFRALVRGEFSLPPARAYLFYAPEPVTEVDGGDLRVD